MAVNINTFYSTKVIQGAAPSNPSFPADQTPPPVLNPPGTSGVSLYKQLIDVLDTDFIGKNGFTPIVVNEQYLQLIPLPQVEQNGLISGGIVQWTGSGYIFNISGAFYRIGGVLYESQPDTLTLSTPDLTNDRIDVFAVDDTGSVVIIEGTPAATPVKPQIDPATQLELTSVIVTAASTTPTLNEEIIYNENTEWTGSSSGTGTANFSSTSNPFQGTVSIETTNIQNGFQIVLDNGSDIDLSTYQTLGFQIDLKANLGSGQNIVLAFLDASNVPVSRPIQLSLDKSSTSYQFIGITISSLQLISNLARKIRFSFTRISGPATYSGFFLDVIKLEGGINPPISIGSFTALSDTPSSYSGQSGKVVAVKSDESGLEFINGGGITGSGTTNEIAYFTGATAIGSLSTATYPSLTELSYVKGVTSSIQTQLNGKPTTFLGLTDTPSSYASEANKWVRVNGTPDALVFDTVSPYDLDQEGATDGQVLAWSTANSRYQPVTPSGGGSKWTDVGIGNIYRNSFVGVGSTSDPEFQIHVRRNQTGTDITNRAVVMIEQQNSGGAASLFVKNNLGKIGGMQFNGSAYASAQFFNKFFFVTSQDDTMEFLTNGDNPTGGTSRIDFRIGGFNEAISHQFEKNGIYRIKNSSRSTTEGAYFQLFNNAGLTELHNRFCIIQQNVNNTYNGITIVAGDNNLSGGTSTITFLAGGYGTDAKILTINKDALVISNSKNFEFSNTTGTKIGTATTQKLSFWNKTPIIQPTNAIAAAAFVANTSGIANDTATFGGYTIGQVVQALQNVGILA